MILVDDASFFSYQTSGKKFETILSNVVNPTLVLPRTLVAVAVELVVVSDRRLRNNLVTFLDFCNFCHPLCSLCHQ